MDERYTGSVRVEIPNARQHSISGMTLDTDMNIQPYWFKLTLLPTKAAKVGPVTFPPPL